MNLPDIKQHIQNYIAIEVLEEKDVGLEEDTPLLEWGIINSFEIVRLVDFLKERFSVEVPFESVQAENFGSINAIAELVMGMNSQAVQAKT